MAQEIYVNLPVKDLKRSRTFFTSLGFGFNEAFSNEQAICMVVSDTIYVILLVEPFFQSFIKKPISDAHQATEVLVCLSRDSRAAVDDMVTKALAAGAQAPNPKQDLGFMYSHGFEDLDGHTWELVYMDPAAAAA